MKKSEIYKGLGFATLLTDGDNNPKTEKSNKSSQYFTTIQHFAHASTAGFGNVCASASAGCIASCLDESGHGNMDSVKRVRKARTKLFMTNRDLYATILRMELDKFVRKADKLGKQLAARLNGTSDIVWEKVMPWIFTEYPSVQFYDYTKHIKRCVDGYVLPKNYHLTFSRSETNDSDCVKVLESGAINVAVVFQNKNYPETWNNKPVYSMDNDDLRFLDPSGGHVGALYAKGGGFNKNHNGFILPT